MKYFIFLILFISCTIEKERIVPKQEHKEEHKQEEVVSIKPLSERGWNKDTRKSYMDELGKDFYSHEITRAFIDGRIFYDMKEDMVILVHGKPNRKSSENVWDYYDVSKNTLLRVKFKNNIVFEFEYMY